MSSARVCVCVGMGAGAGADACVLACVPYLHRSTQPQPFRTLYSTPSAPFTPFIPSTFQLSVIDCSEFLITFFKVGFEEKDKRAKAKAKLKEQKRQKEEVG